jgi:hypothetical protein
MDKSRGFTPLWVSIKSSTINIPQKAAVNTDCRLITYRIYIEETLGATADSTRPFPFRTRAITRFSTKKAAKQYSVT